VRFFAKAHDKYFFPLAVNPVSLVRCLRRAVGQGARQTYIFAVRFHLAHGKIFLKNLIFVLLLISALQKHYFVLYISNLCMTP
jgi:hypothetical protein